MMNDPHVDKLYYTLSTMDTLSFEKCPALIYETLTHCFVLEDNILTCELKRHFAEISAAKDFIKPLIRSWEIDSALFYGKEDFEFVYKNADIIDRNPKPNEINIICGSAIAVVGINSSISVHVTRGAYPEPPTNFLANPEVETLWYRYNMYLQGKEPLLSMAYFCLSHIEGLAAGRHKISSKYFIERQVVDKLGELTSERGDTKTARKGKGHNFPPLTGQEISWIEMFLKRLIRRLGEPSMPNPQMITMLDLPQI